jgi:ABC-type multidrug transport system fused ATPase/permease subunit
MVSADGAIFSGSLGDNIRYKETSASQEDVLRAACDAGLKGLIDRLPEGLETDIGQGGMRLSVGERQRLQIARVLLSRPRILILDEATANLDYNTEAQIKRSVYGMRGECTVIVIAHRYSMVKEADYVYVLDQGSVIEQGNTESLLSQGGWFSEFAASVVEDEVEEVDGFEEVEEVEELELE